jgi:predicted house-cleaning noncanonical NTP pyrophosphatase (MazG superfamily)
MKEELKAIRCAIDGVADEMLEDRRHANMGDLVKVMENISSTLCSISYDLKDLVEQKKHEIEVKVALAK